MDLLQHALHLAHHDFKLSQISLGQIGLRKHGATDRRTCAHATHAGHAICGRSLTIRDCGCVCLQRVPRARVGAGLEGAEAKAHHCQTQDERSHQERLSYRKPPTNADWGGILLNSSHVTSPYSVLHALFKCRRDVDIIRSTASNKQPQNGLPPVGYSVVARARGKVKADSPAPKWEGSGQRYRWNHPSFTSMSRIGAPERRVVLVDLLSSTRVTRSTGNLLTWRLRCRDTIAM